MKNNITFTCFLVCFFLAAQTLLAQTINFSGKVTDATTGQPIPYATVGVAGKSIGTVANAEGSFAFKAEQSSVTKKDKLVISCIGYESQEFAIAAANAQLGEVKLKPQSVELKEVAVKPLKMKSKVLGKNDREFFTHSVYFTLYDEVNDKLGKEIGNIIKIKNKGCFLNDFNFYVSYNEFETVKFRLNIYDVKNGQPDRLLLNEDVLFDVTKDQRGWVKLDLSKYNTHVEGMDEIAVTMQWLTSKGTSDKSKFFGFSTAVSPVHTVVRREKSQAAWEMQGAYHSMYFNADCYKSKEDETALVE